MQIPICTSKQMFESVSVPVATSLVAIAIATENWFRRSILHNLKDTENSLPTF